MLDVRDPIHAFEPLWGLWTADELIGEGNYGRVYRVRRTDDVGSFTAAVKLITVPRSPSELAAVLATGMSLEEAHQRFAAIVRNVVSEIKILHDLRDCAHVVRYEDHLIRQDAETRVWSILIRMELLTPLPRHIRTAGMSQMDVIRLGAEVCEALEACRAREILHRDIKDANIFVARDGTFKLGDFGIALEANKIGGRGPMHGTPLYAAPEVHAGRGCDVTSDLYALGLVLYRLCNRNRLPFLPAPPEPLTEQHAEIALAKRLRGERLPKPEGIDDGLWSVIERACAFAPEDRYANAAQMSAALSAVGGRMNGRRGRSKVLEPMVTPTVEGNGLMPPPETMNYPSSYTFFQSPTQSATLEEWESEPEPVMEAVEAQESAVNRHLWLIPIFVGVLLLTAVGFMAMRGDFSRGTAFQVYEIKPLGTEIIAWMECPGAPPSQVEVSVFEVGDGGTRLMERMEDVPVAKVEQHRMRVDVRLPYVIDAGRYLLQVSGMFDGTRYTCEESFVQEARWME